MAGRSAAVLAALAALAALAVLIMAGCGVLPPSPSSPPTPPQRLALARDVAAQGGLALTHLAIRPPLAAALPAQAPPPDVPLVVYIEGDGHAWRTRDWPSDDPTPVDPVALRLAARHPAGRAVWLARPCQYVDAAATGCPARHWTSGRYAPAATMIMDTALDLLKTRYGVRQFILVGYSGGGTVAALIAARRADVVGLGTVAANLDLGRWLSHHGLPPMPAAIDPATLGERLRALPQVHLAGSLDKIVPPQVVESYGQALGPHPHRRVVEVPGFDHTCCWSRAWPGLVATAWPGPGQPWGPGLPAAGPSTR